jgi:Leucine-rich repeat (LRR) protein
LCSGVHSQTTNVPDSNFEQALIDFGYDSGIPDGVVPTSNISSVVYLDVSQKNISDLTGIEDFDSLDFLDVTANQLISLNVTGNPLLSTLRCGNNQLTALDLSQNSMLTELKVWLNNISTLDLSLNTSLTLVEAFNNQLTNLDLSGLADLYALSLSNNLLDSLDITQNTNLTYLIINENQLTSLNVTQNSALGYLQCEENQLTELNMTQNSNLAELRCRANQLTGLNVSQNIILTSLTCSENQLVCLDVNNGNNMNMTTFIAVSNPSLACIEVDNEIWATTYWTVAGGNIDPIASFSSNCINPCYIGLSELNDSPRKLIRIVDYMGRDIKAVSNTPLFYMYDDGTVQRVFTPIY